MTTRKQRANFIAGGGAIFLIGALVSIICAVRITQATGIFADTDLETVFLCVGIAAILGGAGMALWGVRGFLTSKDSPESELAAAE